MENDFEYFLATSALHLAEAGQIDHARDLLSEIEKISTNEQSLLRIAESALRCFDTSMLFTAVEALRHKISLTSTTKDWLNSIDQGPLKSIAFEQRLKTKKPNLAFKPQYDLLYLQHASLPYQTNGYATRGHGLIDGFIKNNLNIYSMTRPGFPYDLGEEMRNVPNRSNIENVIYHHVEFPKRTDFARSKNDFLAHASSAYIEHSVETLKSIFLKIKPAFILAASNHVTALPALIAGRELGINVGYEVRGFWEITNESRTNGYLKTITGLQEKYLETLVSTHADHVFTLTTPMREEMIARGVPGDKITLAPNSCNPERFNPVDRDPTLAAKYDIPNHVPVIGYIGTFAQYEGLEDLTAACAQLKKRGIEFRLMLVGNENTSGNSKGPITEEILKVAEQSDLADWLIMPGRIPHEDVEAHYSLIDIAPFPRKPQPVSEMVSPMKPLEALAMEKAVIVSSVRALQEMIQDGETGLHFDKGSRDSLCDKLMMLVKDPKLRKRLGQNGRKWVKNERTWEKTTQRIAEVIHDLQ